MYLVDSLWAKVISRSTYTLTRSHQNWPNLGIVLNTLATIIQSSYAAYRGGKERERGKEGERERGREREREREREKERGREREREGEGERERGREGGERGERKRKRSREIELKSEKVRIQ
jgi:hypothetical protein